MQQLLNSFPGCIVAIANDNDDHSKSQTDSIITVSRAHVTYLFVSKYCYELQTAQRINHQFTVFSFATFLWSSVSNYWKEHHSNRSVLENAKIGGGPCRHWALWVWELGGERLDMRGMHYAPPCEKISDYPSGFIITRRIWTDCGLDGFPFVVKIWISFREIPN